MSSYTEINSVAREHWHADHSQVVELLGISHLMISQGAEICSCPRNRVLFHPSAEKFRYGSQIKW